MHSLVFQNWIWKYLHACKPIHFAVVADFFYTEMFLFSSEDISKSNI